MSIHRSLRGVDTLKGERSVITRIERIQILRKEGRFDAAESSPWGLPKVRTKFKVASTKKLKAAAAAGGGAKPEAAETADAGKAAEKANDKAGKGKKK